MSVPAANDSWPLFIVGMNGSGTTMLLDNLGKHPELYAFPKETRLIPYFMGREASFGDLSADDNFEKLWNTMRSLSVFRQVNNGVDVPLPDDWRSTPRSLAGILDRIFLYFAGLENKSRWCEKTPQHVQHMMDLSERYPRARFIHMVRDGRDCAVSFNRRWLRSPSLTVFRWKKVVTGGRRQGDQLGEDRYLEVRYEDLTVDPDFWLRKICDFAGVPFNAAVLESSQPYMEAAEENQGRLQPNSGKWEQHFSSRVNSNLEQIAGSTLHAFGYSTSKPDGNKNLSKMQRKLLAGKDAILQYGREIALKLAGKIERPWSVILGKPFTALRQRGQNRF